MQKTNKDHYPAAEAAKRRDAALRAALSMPPTKHAPAKKKPSKRKATAKAALMPFLDEHIR